KSNRCTASRTCQDVASHATRMRNNTVGEAIGDVNSKPMNPENTPTGGSPMTANATRDSSTANRGMVEASPLTACGSTSSPYLVRMACQASNKPLVLNDTAPTKTGAQTVVMPVAAANHQSIEKSERLP